VPLLCAAGTRFVENAVKFAAAGTQVLLVYPGPHADLDRHAMEFLAKQNPLPSNLSLVIDPALYIHDSLRFAVGCPT
jgi:hypothetical protein